MQKFYFHDATTTDTGTLPTTTLSGLTASVTATGASTNRAMNDTIGTSQTSAALSTLAQTAHQNNWFRRFVSPPLAAQTVPVSPSWSFHCAGSESNTNSLFTVFPMLFVWRPGTGAVVGTVWGSGGTASVSITTTTESAVNIAEPASGSSVAIQNGDILVCEIWGGNTQTKSTSYTNTFFYDGTTEDSATSNAAYLLAPADLPLATTSTPSLVFDTRRVHRNSLLRR